MLLMALLAVSGDPMYAGGGEAGEEREAAFLSSRDGDGDGGGLEVDSSDDVQRGVAAAAGTGVTAPAAAGTGAVS